MNKSIYVSPEINVTLFSEDEVITASTADVTRDPDKPIELPFVPYH